jgi:hypothetical protein
MRSSRYDTPALTLYYTPIYTSKGALAANATTLLRMNFVPSIPALSKIFILPDESRINPAQAIRVNVNEEREIAVDALICFVSDSKMVGDLS